jgi:hypothetical protein
MAWVVIPSGAKESYDVNNKRLLPSVAPSKAGQVEKSPFYSSQCHNIENFSEVFNK